MKKILITLGTRPEAIKLSPLFLKFKQNSNFDVKLCVTAQHRQMLDQVLRLFEITPHVDLNIMRKDQTLFDITSEVLIKFKKILADYLPDYVFVQGDTTTAFVCSLAAFYFKIPVCHVEAGLRTNNMYLPYPEEMNRQLIGRLAKYHFAPTEKARENLLKENILERNIIITGNTGIDALHESIGKLKETSESIVRLIKQIGFTSKEDEKIILVTCHRRENHAQGILDICSVLLKMVDLYDIKVVFPVHMNPNIKNKVYPELENNEKIKLIGPLDYESFIWLMNKSFFIISDSGGIQEEATCLGKPVLVLRDLTERPESVEAGNVRLVGSNNNELLENEVEKLIINQAYYQSMSKTSNVFGDGKASEKIIEFILNQ